MSYTVLALKYRPQTFADLSGQEHIAKTLSNAIETGRVAHAFLFTGARGVGKTTTARLLAKALNCDKGPTPTPCNECDPCVEITKCTDIDVIEMDGASNNSVEDVRRLQETIPYRPARDRFKIIIIDEVHMLSAGAFNALLKTLEEPPEHVKFIFATTEAHKVPITIRSRCQKYDFRLIRRADIAERVREILKEEIIKFDEEALALIATEAAGSMRDALTLLDQLIAAHEKKLEGKKISDALGIADRESTYKILDAILKQDPKALLQELENVVASGVDPIHFLRQLSQFIRDVIVLKLSGDSKSTELTPDEIEIAERTASEVNELELQRQFAGLCKLLDEVGRSANPGLTLEMGLVRLACRPALRSIDEILVRLEQLQGNAPAMGMGASGAKSGAGSLPQQSPRAAKASAPAKTAEITQAPGRHSGPQSAPQPSPILQLAPQQSVAQVAAATASNASAPDASLRRAALQEWERMIRSMKENHPALSAVLEHGVPRRISAERIILSFEKDSFYARQANTKPALDAIRQVAQHLLGATPEIEVRMDATPDSVSGTLAAVDAQQRQQEVQRVKQQALQHPAVRSALEIFPESADKVEVRIGNADAREDS